MEVDLRIGNPAHTLQRIRAMESPPAHTKSTPTEKPPNSLVVITLHSTIKKLPSLIYYFNYMLHHTQLIPAIRIADKKTGYQKKTQTWVDFSILWCLDYFILSFKIKYFHIDRLSFISQGLNEFT